MRAARVILSASVLSVAGHGLAQDFHGAQLVPRWSARGELNVELTNWSKVPLSVERVAVEMRLKGDQPCRFSFQRRVQLSPTDTVTVMVATARQVAECLETQAPAEGPLPRPSPARRAIVPAVRFAPMAAEPRALFPQPTITPADTLTIQADLKFGRQPRSGRSRWRAETRDQG
jgi:hypothetical protein